MHRWLAALVFAACLVIGQGAHALGLGEITTRSALNEPMDAEIALLGATPDELTTLEVRLASRETFERYGIDKPALLNQFRFRLRRGPNPAVEITSSQPVTDPFVTMLIEAVWPRGRLLREYTVLLDPPTYAAPATQSAPQPPVRRAPAPRPETRSSGAVTRSASPASRPARAPLEGDQYRVQRNDTLWEIAQRIQPDQSVSINQVMVAIYEANPQAFDGNINRLNAGAVLQLPDADSLYAINRTAALQEVQRQMQDWRGGSGALVLTPPDDNASATTGRPGAEATSGAAGGAASSAELARLQRELQEKERQLQIRNEELARLQQQLASQSETVEQAGAEAPVSTQDLYADDAAADAGDESPDAASGVFAEPTEPVADAADDISDDAAADDEASEDAAAAADEAAEPSRSRTAPAAVVTTPEPEPSLIDKLMGNIYVWVGAGVVLVGGLLALLARRRSSADEPTGTWEALDSADLEDLDGTLAATGRLRDMGTSKRADASKTAEQPALEQTDSFEATSPVDEVEPPAATTTAASDDDTGSNYSLDDTFSSETAINLDQSDPLAEADFHMAYGLYDQAADLVKNALAVDPSDNKLKAKLAEIYFVWGNQDGFVAAAEDLKSSVSDSDPEWNKVVIMGQQIAPAHALFSGAVASSEGGDLDLSLDETRSTPASIDAQIGGDDDGFGEVFDTAAASDDDGGTVEQVAADISGIDFEFDESMLSDEEDDGGDTAVTDASGIDFEFDGESLEEGTVEQPVVDLGGSGGDVADTQEVDVSDLDLSTGDETDDITDDLLEATGVTSVLPDDFKVSLPDAPADEDETVLADTSSFGEDTAEMDTGGDATREMPAFDETGTAEASAIRPAGAIGDVDLDVADLTSELSVDDLGDTEKTLEQQREDSSPTLFSEEVFGDDSVDSDADTGLNLAIDEDGETGNTNVAEVGTKLDLARAYVDMGDPDGARSILDEVVQEGDAGQKEEARKLLESLG